MNKLYCTYNEEKLEIVGRMDVVPMTDIKLKRYPDEPVSSPIYMAEAVSLTRPGQGALIAIWTNKPEKLENNTLEEPFMVILDR